MTFGETIKAIMVATNIKSNQIANALGYDTSYISRWISGERLPAVKKNDTLFLRIAKYVVSICGEQDHAALATELGIPANCTKSKEQMTNAIANVLETNYSSQRMLLSNMKAQAHIEDNCVMLDEFGTGAFLSAVMQALHNAAADSVENSVEVIIAAPINYDRDFFSRPMDIVDCMISVGRHIHVRHIVSLKNLSQDVDESCRYICTNSMPSNSLEYEYYLTDNEKSCDIFSIYIKDEFYGTVFPFSLNNRKHVFFTKSQSFVSDGYVTAERIIHTAQPIFQRTDNTGLVQNNNLINYMFERDFIHILAIMHPLCLRDEQQARMIGIPMLTNWGATFVNRMLNANKTIYLFRAAFVDFIYQGKIAASGQLIYVNIQGRIDLLKELICYLEAGDPKRLYILEDNNPLICYKDLKQSIYIGNQSMHLSAYDDENSSTIIRSLEVVGLFRSFAEHLMELPEIYMLNSAQTITYFKDSLKWLEGELESSQSGSTEEQE